MNVVTIMYSGLSGTASVVFSLIKADHTGNKHSIIFIGIENAAEEYITNCKNSGIDFYIIVKKPGLDLSAQKKVICYLKNSAPDVVIMHNLNTILPVAYYAAGKKVSVIAVEHQANSLKNQKDWARSMLTMQLADNVVFLTELYRSQMKDKLGILFRTGKTAVINNGLEPGIFSRGIPEERSVIKIGMLARMVDIKDHLTLISAMRLLSEEYGWEKKIKLLLAGSGPMMETLIQSTKTNDLQDQIEFCGFITEKQSASFLKDLDIYVHASYGETMSTAIMQAMASGKAIIASDVTGINNMITHGETGLLVPVKDGDSLAAAIDKLLRNKPLQDKLSLNAYEYAISTFSSANMFRKYAELF